MEPRAAILKSSSSESSKDSDDDTVNIYTGKNTKEIKIHLTNYWLDREEILSTTQILMNQQPCWEDGCEQPAFYFSKDFTNAYCKHHIKKVIDKNDFLNIKDTDSKTIKYLDDIGTYLAKSEIVVSYLDTYVKLGQVLNDEGSKIKHLQDAMNKDILRFIQKHINEKVKVKEIPLLSLKKLSIKLHK